MFSLFIFFLEMLLRILSLIISVLLAVAFLTLGERKVLAAMQRRKGPNIVGFFGLLQPFADALKLLLKETVLPAVANKFLFLWAPMLTFSLSLISWSVIPFNDEFVLIDSNYGVLFLFALSSLSVYGTILGGWSSNSRYGFLGGLRAAAQMISYEVSLGITLLSIVICVGSFNLTEIVMFQEDVWFCFSHFPMLLIFFVSILAETNRPPFDLPEAEAELVSGFNVEYSSAGFALFFIGEYSNILLMSAFLVILFFGGWTFFYFFDNEYAVFIFSIKLLIVTFFFIWVRASLPRFRYDQLMYLGWKLFLPLSISWFIFISTVLYVFDGLPGLGTLWLIKFYMVNYVELYKGYYEYVKSLNQRHYFHMVTPSPWPFLVSIQVFVMLIGAVSYMHFYRNGGYVLLWGIFNIIFIVFLWLRDIIREGTYEGMHTLKMQKNLKFGFILFIVTEVMFFFAFFRAFFHSSLSPAVEIGGVWPPVGIVAINPWKLPFLNTCLLLQSGIYITICHVYMRMREYINVFEFYILTLIFGALFTFIQIYEYINATFSISDGIYGSTFYMLTGFHGFHVLAGTIFIFVCLQRTIYGHFTANHHVGFECAAWYWHFVDVVWLFLFIFVYVWGAWIN